jgi:hypothetical protein
MGIFLTGFISNTVLAQEDLVESFKGDIPKLLNSNNAGTLFWITFHPCWEDPGPNNSLRIYVSSAVATTVTLEIPGLAIIRQKVTIPNDVIEFPLPVSEGQAYSKGNGGLPIRPQPAQVWEGRAIKLSSDYPIVVYGVTRYQYTSDGYLALPVSSLGQKYQVASYEDPTNNTGQFLPSYTSIVGVYENTKVTFRLGGFENMMVPLLNGDTLRANQTMKATLNEGDIWLIPGIGPFNDLTGSTINASKPVNVLSGNFCAYIPSHIGYCDFIIEQELPDNVWGKKYHVTPIQARKNYTIIKIFAKKPMTQYFFDGLPKGTIQNPGGLNGRGWIETRAGSDAKPRPVVVSSNEPINVVQYNPGQDDDGVANDPFQLQLSPIQQYQTEIVFNTPGIRGGFGFKDNFINIAYKATIDGGLPQDMEIAEVLDGQFRWIPLEAFSGNPGTPFNDYDDDGRRYYSKTIKLLYDGVYKLRAKDPFVAYAYGYDSYDSYGFPTSVATADLESPDTLAPYLSFKQGCSGDVIGEVIDEPRIDPENRSNLGLIYMDISNSFNFKFDVAPYTMGISPRTTWTLQVRDETLNGIAHLVFMDRVGNRKDTIIEHYAISPVLSPYQENYGIFKLEDPPATETRTFTLRNDGEREIGDRYSIFVTLDSKVKEEKPNDIYGYQNFDLIGLEKVNLAPMKVGEEIKFDVVFTANQEGYFRDSIGVIVIEKSTGDTCVFTYFALVEAFIGNPYINATDHNFDLQVVNSRSNTIDLILSNPDVAPYKATTALKITGIELTDGLGIKGTDEIFEFEMLGFDLSTLSESNPLILNIGEFRTLRVSFKPALVQEYTGTITWLADTEIPDNLTQLRGRGIQPGLIVNSENWQERLVDPNSYIQKGGVHAFAPYPSANNAITLENNGSAEVTITGVTIVENILGSAFRTDAGQNLSDPNVLLGKFGNMKIAPNSKRTIPVFFHPTVNGNHSLVLTFNSDAPVNPTSTLRGIGVFPKISPEDFDFGHMIVGTGKKTGSVKFTNNVWENDHAVVITNFVTNVVGGATFSEFGGNGIFRWDRNGMTDQNGNAVNFPIKLQPGEYINVPGEFEATTFGSFEVSLTSVSDAEREVTSIWTGTAEVEGSSMQPASAVTCVNRPILMKASITNHGSEVLEIKKLYMQMDPERPIVGGSLNNFEILTLTPFTLDAGITKDIEIIFTPNAEYNNGVLFLMAQTSSTTKPKDSTTVTVTATTVELLSRSLISKGGSKGTTTELNVAPGDVDAIGYSVYIQSDKAVSNSYNTEFTVEVSYSKDFLGIGHNPTNKEAKIIVGDDFAGMGYKIIGTTYSFDPVSNSETVRIKLQGTQNLATNFNRDLEMVRIGFDSYLPIYTDSDGNKVIKNKEAIIRHAIMEEDHCVSFNYAYSKVTLDNVCVDFMRPIQISATKYNLGQVNPNPVGSEGADIVFSVGGKNIPTEIRMYNAQSELVSVPFTGVLNSGEYSVRIPVEELSSGVYFYEMVSGPFKDTKKMIIVK